MPRDQDLPGPWGGPSCVVKAALHVRKDREYNCHWAWNWNASPARQPTGSRRNGRLRPPTNQDETPGFSHSRGPLAVSWTQFPQNRPFSWGPYCFNFMLHQKSKMTAELRYLSLSQEFTLTRVQAVTGSPSRMGSFLSDPRLTSFRFTDWLIDCIRKA